MANTTEEAVNALSQQQQARMVAAWDRVEAGALTLEEFRLLALNIILAGNGEAYRIGYLSTARLVEIATGVAQAVIAESDHHVDADRLSNALVTILGSPQDTLMQLRRITDNEIKGAAQDGAADVIEGSRQVTGWVRDLDGAACQLCTWWARDGRVFRPDHRMPRHTGCGCHQKPVTVQTDNFQTDKQAKQAAEKNRSRNR